MATSTLVNPFFIGFDRYLNAFGPAASQRATYPPYNVVKDSDDTYTIEIAVAGFTSEDLDITEDNSTLTVTGNAPESSERDYLHKGVAMRKFTRSFTLAEHVRVTAAELRDGMLRINLAREVPPEAQPKRIAISA